MEKAYFNTKDLMSTVSLNSIGQLDNLKKELEDCVTQLKRANEAFTSKYTFEEYDEFLLAYIHALELKIDAIIRHAKRLEGESVAEENSPSKESLIGSIAEVYKKYNNTKETR